MKNKENFYLFHSLKRNIYYTFIRCIRKIIWLFNQNKTPQFLFILSPPYCGSTMLNQLLSSSKNVSCNNNLGTREGQLLPIVSQYMFQSDRWDKKVTYPWNEIREIWLKYWDFSKPIFLDKSIPNIMRVEEIEKVFSPIKFMCMVRNPYAQVEGIMRRNNQDAFSSAMFAVKCLKFQSSNMKRNNTLFFSYEQLCSNREDVLKKMINFIPELSDIDVEMKFTSHNFKSDEKMRMVNLNEEKISKISDVDLKIINSIFEKEKDLLKMFDYKIIKR